MASERESGREMAERSIISVQGRRSSSERRAVSETMRRKSLKAGVASAASEKPLPEEGAEAPPLPEEGSVTGSKGCGAAAEAMASVAGGIDS